MSQYVAIVEDPGTERAVGVWFPDLPGCFAAGDTLDEAISNAAEAVGLYAEALEENGRRLPPPRRLSVLRADPVFAADLQGNMVALVAVPDQVPSPAE